MTVVLDGDVAGMVGACGDSGAAGQASTVGDADIAAVERVGVDADGLSDGVRAGGRRGGAGGLRGVGVVFRVSAPPVIIRVDSGAGGRHDGGIALNQPVAVNAAVGH